MNKISNFYNLEKQKIYINRIILLLFFFATFNLYGQNKPITISLGTVCPIAYVLRDLKIRTVAYPFDWLAVPFDGLYKTLNEDFEHFFLKENLIITSTSELDGIMDLYTGITFFHDFPTKAHGILEEDSLESGKIVDNFLDYYDDARKKYNRRITRFQAALNSSQKVILIRYLSTKEEAILLRNLIQLKYPSLNFTLVIINDEKGDNSLWDELNIQRYFIPLQNIWNSKSLEWLYVLNDLNLL